IGGRAAEQNISLFEPIIGVSFKQDLSYKLSLVGDLIYGGWSQKGNGVSNSDYRLGLNWEFGEGWNLDAGYRSMWFYGKDDNSNSLNIRYEGPNILLKFAR
ncbi:MAG: hypothetical protein M1269_11420, partial [Chloroflexi bacterium]|nr:hypothetical protein [Chloroflexota bacterium]